MEKVFWSQGAKVSEKSFAPPKTAFLHRCKMGLHRLKRLSKDLLHPPLTTFGNFPFSVYFPGPQLPKTGPLFFRQLPVAHNVGQDKACRSDFCGAPGENAQNADCLSFHMDQESPRQAKPKKGQFMKFSQGHSGTKVQCESCLVCQGKHQNSQKWSKFMSFLFRPFLWFGLPGQTKFATKSETKSSKNAPKRP